MGNAQKIPNLTLKIKIMKIALEIPDYSPDKGFVYNWEGDFDIEVKYENGDVILSANKEGLTSLAKHLLNLAQDQVPNGYHLHLDEYNSLEEGSVNFIIQKNDNDSLIEKS